MNKDFQAIINRFSQPTVLVIGDLILDVYLKGAAHRLSPEAPVPVVNVSEKQTRIGGAANVAANVRSLGAQVIFCSVCGRDQDGEAAIASLERMGVFTRYILQDPGRRTIVKTRVMTQSRVLARFDEGTERPVGKTAEEKLITYIRKVYSLCDAVIISDYDKGVLTPAVIAALESLQEERPVCLSVDSKRLSALSRLRPSFIKPNYEEAVKLLSLSRRQRGRATQLQGCGRAIFGKTGAAVSAVTLDEEGAVIFDRERPVYVTRAHPVANPSVIGAGDTFLGAFTLALVSGATLPAAAELASAAAAVVAGREGTVCCTHKALSSFFAQRKRYLSSPEELERVCQVYRAQGRRIVFTNGCFDILHSGHVSFLKRAGKLGDVLIVGINNDDSITRLKGRERPVNPLKDRVEVLSALDTVHHVIAFGKTGDDTPVELIRVVKPDVFVKGGDYTKDRLPEAAVVEKFGGEVVLLEQVPDHSTSRVIRRIREVFPLPQVKPAS
ncbi:D-glycero-beta-D-manno-heptose 1-phosphate adenylyltransferase [Compostibacter hankyongensis]|uniref:Bifunctional protein HldE n=1 Tax=Compostibacter hankyongensis TaxID=1007089 RepID=A0ABP8FW35_9BACT